MFKLISVPAFILSSGLGIQLNQAEQSSCECVTEPVTVQQFCDDRNGCVLEAYDEQCNVTEIPSQTWGADGCRAYDNMIDPNNCPLTIEFCRTEWCFVTEECNDPNKQKVNLFGDRDDLYISYDVCGSQPYDRSDLTGFKAGDYEECLAELEE